MHAIFLIYVHCISYLCTLHRVALLWIQLSAVAYFLVLLMNTVQVLHLQLILCHIPVTLLVPG
jgi:hypothetical protein